VDSQDALRACGSGALEPPRRTPRRAGGPGRRYTASAASSSG